MKQTAVEWLVEELDKMNLITIESKAITSTIEQAKKKEKQQKINDFNSGEKKAEKNYEFYIRHLEYKNKIMKQTILQLYDKSKNAFDEFFIVIENENKVDVNSQERISIETLNITRRLSNVLRSIDINYLDEISLWTKKELSKYRNYGTETFKELQKIMDEHNIKFRY